MILTNESANRVDLGDALGVAQLRADDPVLQRAEVFRRVSRSIRLARALFRFNDIHEDLAEPGRDWTELWLKTWRELTANALQTLIHLLTRKVDVRSILEHDCHLRQAVAGHGARVFKAGQTGDCGLDRERDALLRLKRRVTGRFRIDLHLNVRDVRRGVDRQALETPDAKSTEDDNDRQHRPAVHDR